MRDGMGLKLELLLSERKMPVPSAINSANRKPGYEIVFTVQDYQDGPRSGVANFDGKPHFYACVFDDVHDDYTDSYILTPITEQTFEAALENWEIFLRWRAAFDLGKVALDTHPALPQDTIRYQQTKRILEAALLLGQDKAIHARGVFDVVGRASQPRDVLTPWQAKWIIT
jgi:hypothetical protein